MGGLTLPSAESPLRLKTPSKQNSTNVLGYWCLSKDEAGAAVLRLSNGN